MKHQTRAMEYARRRGAVSMAELARQGVPRLTVLRLERAGRLVRTSRGIYEAVEAPVTEHHGLVRAQARVKHGVIGLMSALQFHGLTTQVPFEVWMLIGARARLPKVDGPRIRFVRAKDATLVHGVETHEVEGVPVRITNAARTVADCFKYRRLVGLDVALEALRDYRTRRGSIQALWEAAKVDRVTSVIRPYLEAVG